ncbi:MAG: recombinase family protein [Phycisphaerae bacterium]|nr:MAG: recombinase family protein [Phycisphaerae bacterium]
MRVVALFRVSTEKQATEGASLDAQERVYREHAARAGWTTVAEFRGCESATQASSDRHVLQSVLACLREKACDAVYVHEQSRLTRGDELECALLMRELRERGTKIIVNGIVRDPSSIDDGFMLGIQSLVDRTESLRIKERLARGKRQKALQGKRTSGRAPYGYRNPHKHEPGHGTLVVVPGEAEVVRRVFAMAAAGRGGRGIARTLNSEGVAAPLGGRWGKSTVARLLANPVYRGASAHAVWVKQRGGGFALDVANEHAVVVENAHEPILDRDLWDAVANRPRVPRTATPRLLTGLLFVDGRRYEGDGEACRPVYRAPRGVKGGAWLDMTPTDDAVWERFERLATSPEYVEGLLREAHDPKAADRAAAEIERIDAKRAKLQARLENLLTMRADGEISKETYLSRSSATEGELTTLDAARADAVAKAGVLGHGAARRVVGAIRAILAGKGRLDVRQKRVALQAVVRRIDVEVARSDAPLPRDGRGRVVSATLPRWRVEKVTFTLALPAESRADVADDRCGQLATTYSCSARPAPARP